MAVTYHNTVIIDDSNGEIQIAFLSRDREVPLLTISQGTDEERENGSDDVISLEGESLRQLREILNAWTFVDEYTEE